MLLTPARMERADGFFARHGGKVVTVARFVDGLRQTNGIIAGTTEMPWRRFLPFNLLGAVLWAGAWGTFGYLAGANIGAVYRTAIRYQLWFAIGLGVLVAAFLLRQVLRYRRRRRADADTDSDAAPHEDEAPGEDAAPGEEADEA